MCPLAALTHAVAFCAPQEELSSLYRSTGAEITLHENVSHEIHILTERSRAQGSPCHVVAGKLVQSIKRASGDAAGPEPCPKVQRLCGTLHAPERRQGTEGGCVVGNREQKDKGRPTPERLRLRVGALAAVAVAAILTGALFNSIGLLCSSHVKWGGWWLRLRFATPGRSGVRWR